MDIVREYVLQYRTAAIALVVILFAVSGLILRKYRILAIIFIFIGSLIAYLLLYSNAVKAPDIDKLKERTKHKVLQQIK